MSGHTPGPWLVELDDRGNVVSVRASGIAPGAVEAKVLLDNSFMLPSSSRAHANARLIAAAPEMLDALRQIAACFDAQGEWRDDAPMDMMSVGDVARAAIAKAVKP